MQLDNQLASAHFPTVLSPVHSPGPAPASSSRRCLLKPCLDLVVLKRARPAYNQDVFKYVKFLAQEFCVQLERDFLDALLRSWTWSADGRGDRYDDYHRSLEGLRQDVALSYVPVHFIGVVRADILFVRS